MFEWLRWSRVKNQCWRQAERLYKRCGNPEQDEAYLLYHESMQDYLPQEVYVKDKVFNVLQDNGVNLWAACRTGDKVCFKLMLGMVSFRAKGREVYPMGWNITIVPNRYSGQE